MRCRFALPRLLNWVTQPDTVNHPLANSHAASRAAGRETDTKKLRVSLFQSDQDVQPSMQEGTFAELGEFLRQSREVSCALATKLRDGTEVPSLICPSLTPGSANKCEAKCVEAWSPAIFSGTRRAKNVVGMGCLVFDVDHVTFQELEEIDAAIEREGYAAILHSTHSNNPARNDWCMRVVLSVTRELLPNEIKPTRSAVQAQLGFRADPQTVDLGRIYYYPTRPKGGPEFKFAIVDGKEVEPVTFLPGAAPAEPLAPPPGTSTTADVPEQPIDMVALRLTLKKGTTDPAMQELLRRVFASERLAESGGRDNALHKLCSYIGFTIPNVPISAKLWLIQDSVMAMEPPERGSWSDAARKQFERAHKDWQEKDAENRRHAEGTRLATLCPEQPTTPRPIVVVTTEDDQVIRQAEEALAARDGQLYVNARRVVLVRDGQLVRVGPHDLSQRLSASIDFCRPAPPGKDEGGRVRAPKFIADTIYERGSQLLQRIDRISKCPVVLPNGEIASGAGTYDNESRVYFDVALHLPPMPQRPSQADAVAAREALYRVVREFPFENEAQRAAWLAHLLTAFARGLYSGNTPALLVTAPEQGTGKGTLIGVILTIVEGNVPTCAFPSDDELRKTIYSYALEGRRFVNFDNLKDGSTLSSPHLEALITSSVVEQRNLHANTVGSPPNHLQILASGNNIGLSRDMARRTLVVRLDTGEEHPENRSGFEIPNLLPWVAANRSSLVAHCLTILRAYVCAGFPAQGVGPFGSFESWAVTVGGAVMFAGGADPTLAKGSAADYTDADTEILRGLIACMAVADPKGEGITARELIANMRGAAVEDVLRDATFAKAGEAVAPKALGHVLAKFAGRLRDGKKIVSSGRDGKNTQLWKVVRSSKEPS